MATVIAGSQIFVGLLRHGAGIRPNLDGHFSPGIWSETDAISAPSQAREALMSGDTECRPSWIDRFGDYRPTTKDYVILILAALLLRSHLSAVVVRTYGGPRVKGGPS